MRKILILAAALLALAAPSVSAQTIEKPPGAVYQTAPYNANPKHFTMTTCKPKSSCSMGQSEALKSANECAS